MYTLSNLNQFDLEWVANVSSTTFKYYDKILNSPETQSSSCSEDRGQREVTECVCVQSLVEALTLYSLTDSNTHV